MSIAAKFNSGTEDPYNLPSATVAPDRAVGADFVISSKGISLLSTQYSSVCSQWIHEFSSQFEDHVMSMSTNAHQLARATNYTELVEGTCDDVIKIGESLLTIQGDDGYQSKINSQVIFRQKLGIPEGWQVGDTHCHTDWSDGFPNTVSSLASRAQAFGFNSLFITDHIQMFDRKGMIGGIIPWGLHSKNPPQGQTDEISAYIGEVSRERDILLVPSYEYSTYKRLANPNSNKSDSHLLAYGSPNDAHEVLPNPFSEEDGLESYSGLFLAAQVRQRRMACSIAHPYSKNYPWFGSIWDKSFDEVFGDIPIGIELIWPRLDTKLLQAEPRTLDRAIFELMQGKRLFFTAGSDAHGLSLFGNYYTYVYTGMAEPSPVNIVEAMKRGRTVASTGPFISVTASEHLPGDTIELHKGQTIRIVARWIGHTSLFAAGPSHIELWLSWSDRQRIILKKLHSDQEGGLSEYSGAVDIEGPDDPDRPASFFGFVNHTFTAAYSSPTYVRLVN